jgi:iron-sulfur cluster repair protein YtfE (RIC family)
VGVTLRIGAGPPPSFDDPIAFFLHCHRRFEERLATLERAAAALEPSPEEAAATLRDALGQLETASLRHTEDEELSVWPRVVDEEIRERLDDLTAEHRAVEAIQLALRDVVARLAPALYPELRAHVAALAAAYRDHMRKEEELVMPRLGKLDPAEVRAIGIEMRIRRG